MRKLSLPLSRLNVSALASLLSNVIAKMSGNSNFPSPPVTMVVLQAALDKLHKLMDNARQGSRQDKMLRDDQVVVVQQLLQQQANYVEGIALGDLPILESSGFAIAKLPTPLGIPNAPRNVVAIYTGKRGQIDLRFNGSRGAKFYTVLCSTDPGNTTSWTTLANTTRNRYSAIDLLSNITHYFRIVAIGAAGESVASDTVFCVAA